MSRTRTALVGLLILSILGFVIVWGVGSALTRSTNRDVPSPVAPAIPVVIDSSPGVRLAATYWSGPSDDAPAILLLHGNGGSRAGAGDTALLLNRNGYAVLAIDFRGHGQSTPAGKSFGLFEAEDAWAAFRWLRSRSPTGRIGVIGYSLGGAAALLGSQGPVPADALVLEGVYPDIRSAIFDRLASRLGRWPATLAEPLLSYQSLPRFGVWPSRIAPIRALAGVREPVMIVGGGNDTNTPPEETRALYDVVRAHGALQILPGVTHERLGQKLPPAFQANLIAFFDRTLKPGGRRAAY